MNPTREEIVAYRLAKSDKDIRSVKTLIVSEDWEVVVNRLYYAAFQAVSALLFQEGIKAKARSGAKAMRELHFVKAGRLSADGGRFYAQLFDERNDSDYEDFAVFTADDVRPLVPQTEEFIDVIKRLIKPN